MLNSSQMYSNSDNESIRSWMNTSYIWYYYDNTSLPYSEYYDYDISDLDNLNRKIDLYHDIIQTLHKIYWLLAFQGI